LNPSSITETARGGLEVVSNPSAAQTPSVFP
jgi:hypothetical protein